MQPQAVGQVWVGPETTRPIFNPLQPEQSTEAAILAVLPEVIWAFSPNFQTLEYISPGCELVLGRTVAELMTQPGLWQEIIHPEDRASVAAAIGNISTPLSREVIYRVILPGGGLRWVRSRGRIELNPDGTPLRAVGITSDITARLQAEETLLRHDAILAAVAKVAERLQSTSWSDLLPELLSGLGMALGAARAFLYQSMPSSRKQPSARLVGEWNAPGLSRPASAEHPKVAPVAPWLPELAAGKVVLINSDDPLPERQALLAALSTRALVLLPLMVEERLWGALGFSESRAARGWLPAEEDALKTAASLLAAAILRGQAEDQLAMLLEAEREERRVAQVLQEIGTIFNQTLNFDRILDLALTVLPQVVPYDAAAILLINGERAYVARQRGHGSNGGPDFLGNFFTIAQTPSLFKVVSARRTHIIRDTQADPDWVQLPGYEWRYHSWIGTPLLVGDQVEIILSLDKLEPHYYTQAHAGRLALFASQAGLALRNAHLYGATLTDFEREQRMGEVIRAIGSELNQETILRRVVRLAAEVGQAEAGALAILDESGSRFEQTYYHNLPEYLQEAANQSDTSDERGQNLAWEVVESGRPLLVPDYAVHPKARPLWLQAGLHAFYAAPILAGSACLGALAVFNYDEARSFEARDLTQVEMIGRQAGIAIQNARLFAAARRRAAEADTLRKAASTVNSALALNEVIENILDQLKAVISYDSAALFMQEGDYLRARAGRGFADLAQLMERRIPLNSGLFSLVAEANQVVVIPDMQSHPRFQRWGSTHTPRIHGWMGVPLRARGSHIGYLAIDCFRPNAYSTNDAELAQAFADEAAIAIENARLFEQVQRLAITDPLTGLYNRRYFFEGARREFERAARYQLPLAVVMLDLDHFKQVNDSYGHQAGDRVLAVVAGQCQVSLREVDLLARYGGEEFIFLLPQTNLEGAQQMAERLCVQLKKQPVEIGGQQIAISASLGVAERTAETIDLQDLIHRADQALYAAKEAGRGCVKLFKG